MKNIIPDSTLLLTNITDGQFTIFIIVSSILIAVIAKSIVSSDQSSAYDSPQSHGIQTQEKDKHITVIINNAPPPQKGITLESIFALLFIGAGFLLVTGREEILFNMLNYLLVLFQQVLGFLAKS